MTQLMPINDVIIANKETTYPTSAAVDPPISGEIRKKKSGAFGIFRAALFVMRNRRGGDKSKTKTDHLADQNNKNNNNNAATNWTKLVGSVRPLHLHETGGSPPPAAAAEEIIPPASPTASSSSGGGMSQYASAASLRDLYNSSDDEEDDDPDEVFDAITGDEMIDAKAEEFIAQFYKQIHLQKNAKTHHHHERGV